MDDWARILKALPNLSKTQLAELGQRVRVLEQLGEGPAGEANSDEQFVLNTLRELILANGGDNVSITMLDRAANSAFRQKVPPLMQYIRNGHPSKTGQRVLLLTALELMLRDMQQLGLTVSAKTMMAHVHRVPAVLNKHFPGYARAGLLHRIVDSKPRGNAI